MLAYYWVMAAPTWGHIFGCYLYTAVNIFHVHYDEAFSALRTPDFKGFSRIHISPTGDLHIYGLAMDKVPSAWREDPQWRGRSGGASGTSPHIWRLSRPDGSPGSSPRAPDAATPPRTFP
eukprot:jgi/Botrbrau1/605/Bobra.0161s0003.1